MNSQVKNRKHQIPKSLHTITAIANVARFIKTVHTHADDAAAIRSAVIVLGYIDTPDTYELAAKALKALNAL